MVHVCAAEKSFVPFVLWYRRNFVSNVIEEKWICKLQNAAAHQSLCGDLYYFYRRFAAFKLAAKNTGGRKPVTIWTSASNCHGA